MDVTPLISSDKQIIQSYSETGFKISGKVYNSSVIVFPTRIVEWAPSPLAEIKQNDLDIQGLRDLDVILLGTGKAMSFPPPAFRKAMKEEGVQLEAMDTGAACRTYNVLMAEGRRVAAALYKIQ
ncbi:MAG: hypothetical protein CMH28_01185 [Micavibrio sp.]|nr:hypothetical protein [Micavibrio sp.]|tara:strand:- start:914 stop:1285 length:372 start_codon:yes stop_codon:yes gene_type:complete